MKKTGAGRRSIRRSPLRTADPISLRLDARMAPKYHPTPLSGGDRKALAKVSRPLCVESRCDAVTSIANERSADTPQDCGATADIIGHIAKADQNGGYDNGIDREEPRS
jgi:hypothetical protein